MDSGKLTPSEWAPLVVSFIADLLTVLAFVGVVATRAVRLAVGSSFVVLGLVVGGVTMIRAVRLWRSPEGQYYPPEYHRRRLASAVVVLVMAGMLSGFVVDLMLAGGSAHTKVRAVEATTRAGRPSN